MGSSVVTVLGIDPGLTRCGIGAVRGPVATPSLIEAGWVGSDPSLAAGERLRALRDAVAAVIDRVRPDVVAVERVLFSVNTRTAMATGQAAGVALLAAAEAGVPVVSYSPNEVKQTVTGDGAADKDAVARLVRAQLGVAEVAGPVDVTDALAVALTHLAHGRVGALLAAAGGGSGDARGDLEAARADAASAGSDWAARVAGHRIVSSVGGRGA